MSERLGKIRIRKVRINHRIDSGGSPPILTLEREGAHQIRILYGY
jgi:hypothetical protein